MVGGSTINIKPECVVYSLMRRPRIVYGNIKIIQFIVIIILLFYLGHAIEHGKVKGSHMTFNVQHESSFNLH